MSLILAFTLIILFVWLGFSLQAIVNLLTAPRLGNKPPSEGFCPKVSFVIPARNEARNIGRTLEALVSQSWSNLEVVVVDDQSEDETAAIVGAIAKNDPRVRLVSGTDRPDEWLGKPWAQEQGARQASGEWLFFVDADVIYEPDAVTSLMAHVEDHLDCPFFFVMPKVETKGFWENALMPGLPNGLFLSVPIWLANRTRFVPLGVGGGTGNLVRAEVYREIGGHERLRNAIVDDIGMARMFRAFGHATRIVWGRDHVRIRMYHGLGEMVEGFTKNSYVVFAGTVPRAVMFAVAIVVIHFTPWVAALGGAMGFVPQQVAVAGAAALGVVHGSRVILYRVFGYPFLAALFLHPVEVLLLLYVFARSTLQVGVFGTARWRGRQYPAKITTFGEMPDKH